MVVIRYHYRYLLHSVRLQIVENEMDDSMRRDKTKMKVLRKVRRRLRFLIIKV